MEFPKLPYNLNRNRKIMDYEDIAIKKLFAEGKTIAYLSRKFGVTWTTIKKHVDEKYRKQSVKASVEAHKKWYDHLSDKEKKELWRYAHNDLKAHAKRFSPQQKYLNFINEQNHNKPMNYKKRMKQQKEYTSRPKIHKKILERQRKAYKTNPQRRQYHHDYDIRYKKTHILVNGKWVKR